jgi:hypothetical protein
VEGKEGKAGQRTDFENEDCKWQMGTAKHKKKNGEGQKQMEKMNMRKKKMKRHNKRRSGGINRQSIN